MRALGRAAATPHCVAVSLWWRRTIRARPLRRRCGPADAVLANGSPSTVDDVDANGVEGVEQCLRQDSFVGREAGDAGVFFACPVNDGGVGGGGEGLEECGHRGQHLGPVPCVDVAGAPAFGDGGSANSAR